MVYGETKFSKFEQRFSNYPEAWLKYEQLRLWGFKVSLSPNARALS